MDTETVVDQITAAKALNADLSAKLTALEADKATAEKLMAEADARASELSAKLEAAQGLIATGNAALADLTAKLTAAETAKAEAEAERAKLADAVGRNPAFADAASNGRKPVAEQHGASVSSEELWNQYRQMTDPKAKREFYLKHLKGL